MLAVSISMEPTVTAGVPRVLFEGPYVPSAGRGRPYDRTPDGRYLMVKTVGQTDAAGEIVLVQNWSQELERLVPFP